MKRGYSLLLQDPPRSPRVAETIEITHEIEAFEKKENGDGTTAGVKHILMA